MIDRTKRNALKWGIVTGLGVAAGTHTLAVRAQSIDGPSVADTIKLLSHPIGVELLLMRIRLLLATLAHVAERIRPGEDLKLTLRSACK